MLQRACTFLCDRPSWSLRIRHNGQGTLHLPHQTPGTGSAQGSVRNSSINSPPSRPRTISFGGIQASKTRIWPCPGFCPAADSAANIPHPPPPPPLPRTRRHKLSSLWLPPEVAAVLDGDTPHSQRSAIMGGGSTRGSSIVLTNPDMLHCSVLPYHKRFVALLSSLRFRSRTFVSGTTKTLHFLSLPPSLPP